MRNFRELMEQSWVDNRFVCCGLDTDYDKIPKDVCGAVGDYDHCVYSTVVNYNRLIVDATHDIVGFYKPNIAFYEGFGLPALQALRETIQYINQVAPQRPIILDAKRADIGSTNEGYARAAFSIYNADAITVNPYFGREALQPFLRHENKGIFVLCRTSNPGAFELQSRSLQHHPEDEGEELYEHVARVVVSDWNTSNNCGLVAGATNPRELARIRFLAKELPLLIPGIGAQGGETEATVKAGKDSKGTGMIINSSRGIIFPKRETNESQKDAIHREALSLHNLINQHRQEKSQ